MSNVSIHDTCFTVNRGELPHMMHKQGNEHWKNFKDTLAFLGSIGFYVGEDKRIKKEFPILLDDHKEGRYGDLKFKAKYAINLFEITFYQDFCFTNPNGGYYDFDKLEKMPYLILKQYELTQKKLIAFFESKGFDVSFRENKEIGAAFIVKAYIKSWHHPQTSAFDLSEIDGETPEYESNATDRDGNIVHNGEVKYFRDRSGYLQRGKVYHNINNMWWVIVGDSVRNICCQDLFDLSDQECRGRLMPHRPPKEYAERKKQLTLCSDKELINELKLRKAKEKGGVA